MGSAHKPSFSPRPGEKYGLHTLGVVNSLVMPLATDDLVLTIDPCQFITSIRYLMGQTTG